MNNTFSKELYDKIYRNISNKLVTGSDRINKEKFEKEYNENFEIINYKINNMTYQFTRFEKKERNGRYVYIPTIRDKIVIEYLKWNLQKKFKIRMQSRDEIISELRCLLKEPINYTVIRLDIKSFFNNIDHGILINKLKKSSLCTTQEFYLIKCILENTGIGVPQGLSISNYLAEIFMESFDIRLRKLNDRISYYARYVDDIIMVIPGKMTTFEFNEIETSIKDLFSRYNLSLNENKTQYIYWGLKPDSKFEYLGYTFTKPGKDLVMGIASDKMGKLFNKADHIFDSFSSDNNFQLLYERVKIFTSVNLLYKTSYNETAGYYTKPIIFGINYDYRFVSSKYINRINSYLKRKIIHNINMDRKEKRMLYALLVKQPDEKYRIIVYSKIKLMTLKSVVYKMYNGAFLWSDIMCMKRKELVNLYFALAKYY